MNCLVLLLVFLSNLAYASSKQLSDMNYNHGIRNLGFKFIILKRKKYPKLLDNIKNKSQNLYDKTIARVSECMCEYEKLSPEDKAFVEFIISTIL